MATSRISVWEGVSCRQRSTTTSSSWPSLKTSAVTRTGSPTALLTGWRPQSICGCTFSMTVLPMRPAIRPPPPARKSTCRERGQCEHSPVYAKCTHFGSSPRAFRWAGLRFCERPTGRSLCDLDGAAIDPSRRPGFAGEVVGRGEGRRPRTQGGRSRLRSEVAVRRIGEVRRTEHVVRSVPGRAALPDVEVEAAGLVRRVDGEILAAVVHRNVVEELDVVGVEAVHLARLQELRRREHVVEGRVVHHVDVVGPVDVDAAAAVVVDDVVRDVGAARVWHSDHVVLAERVLGMQGVVDDDAVAIVDGGWPAGWAGHLVEMLPHP